MPTNCCVNSIVIASAAQGLLAMTDGVIHVPQVDFLNSGRLLSSAGGAGAPKKGNLDAMKACCCHLTDALLLAGGPPASGLELVC